jgi:hypothetical protein
MKSKRADTAEKNLSSVQFLLFFMKIAEQIYFCSAFKMAAAYWLPSSCK